MYSEPVQSTSVGRCTLSNIQTPCVNINVNPNDSSGQTNAQGPGQRPPNGQRPPAGSNNQGRRKRHSDEIVEQFFKLDHNLYFDKFGISRAQRHKRGAHVECTGVVHSDAGVWNNCGWKGDDEGCVGHANATMPGIARTQDYGTNQQDSNTSSDESSVTTASSHVFTVTVLLIFGLIF